MLINASYFVNELLLPNLTESHAGYDIDSLIQDTSHSFLSSILGHDAYNDFISNLDEYGDLKPDAAQKWEDLVYGCDYEHNGATKYFKGLIYKRGTVPKSILAQYVYIKYIEQNVSQLTPTGDVRPNSQNAVNINSSQRYANAWNNFLVSLRGKNDYCGPRHYYHNGTLVIDHFNNHHNEEPSLFQYLSERSELYGKVPLQLPNGESINYRNSLGL